MTLLPNLLAALILLALCNQVAAEDFYQIINRLRAGDAACAHAANLQPLAANPQLERAAAAVAKGGVLAESVKDSGYRATRSAAIRLSGGGTSEERLAVLQSRHCAQLLDPASTDIGIYQDERQLAVVLAAAPRVSESEAAAAQKILALVNKARAVRRNCGDKSFRAVGPLRWNGTLAQASRSHAEDMARHSYMSHDGRDGSDPAQRVARAGYHARVTGENVAAGQMTSEDVVASWIKSPAHCANLMHPAYTEMGVAFAVDAASQRGVYWAQVFGSPR